MIDSTNKKNYIFYSLNINMKIFVIMIEKSEKHDLILIEF